MNKYDGESLDILNKAWRKRCFTSKTTIKIDDLVKGFPPNKNMRGVVDKLVKQGVLVKIPHKYGAKVYINPNYRKKVYDALKKSNLFPY